ncbi:McrC family protein [Hymenobacter sp. DG25B]|uniref:McrC family protein n=1 Tax=Hymenobacter sp. DG25B TaxID=1385664 RepID=UPI000662088D|nr:hypothetical protein [Hymenobacter sp. DG25B]
MAKIMRVLEHSTLSIGDEQSGVKFEVKHWHQLFRYRDEKSANRFYDMRHDGVRFRSYVGVIQTGDLTIEILPKVDDVNVASDQTMAKWRDILLRMLHESGTLNLDSLTNAFLHEKENSLLDIYLELFLNEVEKLLHRGLVKRYRHTEGQQSALRGAIQFSKHISQNLTHQERFYTRHQTYDQQHLHNQLIRQALLLLPRLTNSFTLRGRTARALLQWAEAPVLKVTAATFARLSYDRKTEAYRPAIVIARLLLLHHRPDIRGGNNDLIALLFNMNQLWEKYLLRTLRRLSSSYDCTVVKPSYSTLWKAENGTISKMQPDILITAPGKRNIVLDAKWKRPKGLPSEVDLRQLYTYAHYYDATHAVLLYPHTDYVSAVSGKFQQPEHLPACKPDDLIVCSTVFVQIGKGNSLGTDGDYDSLGYLHCTLESEFKNWLGSGSTISIL